MISLVKVVVGLDYCEFDDCLMIVIYFWFGLLLKILVIIKKQIKKVDLVSVWMEVMQIVGFIEVEVDKLFGCVDCKLVVMFEFRLWFFVEVCIDYINRYVELLKLM